MRKNWLANGHEIWNSLIVFTQIHTELAVDEAGMSEAGGWGPRFLPRPYFLPPMIFGSHVTTRPPRFSDLPTSLQGKGPWRLRHAYYCPKTRRFKCDKSWEFSPFQTASRKIVWQIWFSNCCSATDQKHLNSELVYFTRKHWSEI